MNLVMTDLIGDLVTGRSTRDEACLRVCVCKGGVRTWCVGWG